MIALVTALVLGSAVASAAPDACQRMDDGYIIGPVGGALLDGSAGAAGRVCPRNSFGVSAGAYALIDTPNFYGHILANGNVSASMVFGESTEVFGELELMRYDSVISAVASTYTGFGHTTVGVRQLMFTEAYTAIALHSRLVLPTAFALYDGNSPMVLDVGGSVRYEVTPLFHVRGHLSVLSSGNVGKGATDFRLGLNPTFGAEWRAGKAFGMGLDVANGFGYDAIYDHTAVALGFRFSDGKRFGSELALRKPLAGRERALATLELSFRVRLGELPES